MIRGQEFHSIIENVFIDVKGLQVSEQLQVNCPRCQERDGLAYPDGKYNLEISTSKRMFRCWKCDEPKFSGSLKRLIRLYGTSIDYDLYKSYASIYPDYVSEEDDDIEYALVKLPEEMILFSQMDVTDPDHLEAYTYMVAERKISRDIMLKYRLGFCVTGKYARRVIIPSYGKDGEINYFVGRSYDPKEKKKKYDNPKSDKDKIIFNEGFVNWDSVVFIVEGVFEMFRVPNAIPVLGKTLSRTLFFKLKELKPNIIIILDPDAYKNAIELFYMLQNMYVDNEEKIKIVKLPTNDDLDELYRNDGIDAVISAIRNAKTLDVDDYFIRKLHK